MKHSILEKNNLSRLGTSLLVSGLVMLQGCTAMSRERPVPDDPYYAPVRAETMMQNDPHSGAIFQPSRNYSLYGDTVALNIGDVLTVELEESTQASKNAESSITKDTDISLPNPTVLGRANFDLATDVNVERDFQGAADADQSNSLNGSITVTVTEVLPNGVLRIRGEKWL